MPDYSRKNVVFDNCEKSEKRYADGNADRLLEKQAELRKHIDEEFIDINQYMMDLVEHVGK